MMGRKESFSFTMRPSFSILLWNKTLCFHENLQLLSLWYEIVYDYQLLEMPQLTTLVFGMQSFEQVNRLNISCLYFTIVWFLDFPKLTEIRFGRDSFRETTSLILECMNKYMTLWIDLPKLQSLSLEEYALDMLTDLKMKGLFIG